MAETNLTKEIKESLRSYRSIMKSQMRTVRWAEEVDVVTGFVDVIRFEDYIESSQKETGCKGVRPLKSFCKDMICEECYMWGERTVHTLGIATTCYEIKITKSDFKSKNGHNFVGNFNYYVVPKELYPTIKDLVPEEIGVILYHGHGYLKMKKECIFQKVAPEDLNRYLYNALKKWVDLDWKLTGR